MVRLLGRLPRSQDEPGDLYHCCHPATPALGEVRTVPTGDAALVYEELFVGDYGGNCDEFHAREVLPRLYLSADRS